MSSKYILGGAAFCCLVGACSSDTKPGPIESAEGGVSSDAAADGVGEGTCTVNLGPSADTQTDVQTALIDAPADSVICFGEGEYLFTDELSLSTRNVTLRGVGNAVWNFRNQRATARNGLLATGDHFTIENLTIKNTAGDGVRVEGASYVTFRKLKVLWEDDALRLDDAGAGLSGAYAVYPVQCDHVLIEECDVMGARDAAIYVGQSTMAVVRNNQVHASVAGIEIENTQDAEVHGNRTWDNSAGILVFNLPDLPVQDGRRASVHDNVVEMNNRANFAVAGTIVAGVPNGVGMLILAASQTEVYKNQIRNNDSTGLIMVSCFTYNGFTDCTSATPGYYQYPQAEYIHDNVFESNGAHPAPLLSIIGPAPLEDILWDGDVDPPKKDEPTLRQCIANNGTATFRNFDSRNSFVTQSTDLAPHQCSYPPLPPVSVDP